MRPAVLPLLRLCAAAVLLGGLLAPLAGAGALAQPAPGAAPPDQTAANPPERVGWLQQISGSVSFHTVGQDQWSPAAANYPVASGSALWTQPNGSAWVVISDSRIDMAGGTELDVATLDPSGFQATLPQGELYLRLRNLAPNETWSVQTPRGLVTFAGGGRYGVIAGDTQDPTLVTVLAGSAQISGPGFALQVAAGQTATATGAQTFQGSVGPAQTDAFLIAADRPPPAPPPGAAAPAVVAQMPGADELSAYGSWTDTSDYGQVWYPQVPATWAPYQEGYWGYVAPWGWTWIDSDPWGFAPFHYGRWARIHDRWGWTPGVVAVSGPPVYAPALVAFIGIGLGAAVEAGTVGWFPLGPQEAYHPWYHASNAYLQAVNRRDVRNLASIGRPLPMDSFLNRGALTAVPAAAMAASRPVREAAVHIDPHMLATARPVIGTAPIRPTAATVGVTPNFAREMHLPAAPAGIAAAARVAPGPVIHAMPPVHGVAARAPLPPLAPHVAGAPRPGGALQPAAPAHEAVHPAGVTAAPALRSPGAREGGPPALGPATPGHPEQRGGVAPAGIARPGTLPLGAEHGPAAPLPQVQRAQQPAEHPAEVAPRPAERPAEQVRPAERPAEQVRPPAAVQSAHPPAIAAPAHPPVEHVVPAAPRPEVQHPAPQVLRPEVQHPAPPAPRPEVHAAPPAPRPEERPAPRPPEPRPAPPPVQHAAPPRPPEPAHVAPPAPRPAPPPRPAPAEHEKRQEQH